MGVWSEGNQQRNMGFSSRTEWNLILPTICKSLGTDSPQEPPTQLSQHLVFGLGRLEGENQLSLLNSWPIEIWDIKFVLC